MEGSAVITGASSDIGRAIAVSLAALILKVHLWGRDPDRITATADACRKAGANSVTETLLDVRNSQAVRAAASAIVDGPESLKAVVWAADTFQWGRFDTVDETEMDDVLASTFTAAVVAAASSRGRSHRGPVHHRLTQQRLPHRDRSAPRHTPRLTIGGIPPAMNQSGVGEPRRPDGRSWVHLGEHVGSKHVVAAQHVGCQSKWVATGA